MKLRYMDAPQGVQEGAVATGTAQPFTDWKYLTAGQTTGAYATLEPMGWPLDGSRSLMADSPTMGFWSLPGSTAGIQLKLPRRCSASGVTVRFSPATGEFCRRLVVCWYAADVLVARQTVTPTGPVCLVDRAVEDFDRLVFQPLDPNLPGHFIKIEYVAVGKDLWFDTSQLTRVQLTREADPLLASVKPETMTVAVEWEQPLDLQPQHNQKMELHRNGQLQAVQYIQRSTRQGPGSYTFFCTDAVGLLEGDFLGGMYDNTSAAWVLKQVLEGLPYELHNSLQGARLTGYLPICSRQKALQQIAFALGAVVSTRGDGVIRLVPLTRQVGKPLLKKDIFLGSSLQTQQAVTQVEVAAHRYARDQQERKLLSEVPIHGENVLLTFSSPHHSYAVSGGTLTGQDANWVRITADGPVTLTAKGYLHNAVRHVRRDPLNIQGEVYTVDSATLVHSGNVQSVLNRLYHASAMRQKLHQQAVVTTQNPGQTVTCESPWGALFQGYITAMELSLTPGGQIANMQVLGRYLTRDRHAYSGEFYAGEEVIPWS